MSDSQWLRRMIGFGLLGVAAMTVLVPGVLLAHGTTGHDWYAAGELTRAKAMLFVGFSEYTQVPYRTPYGDIWTLPRIVLIEMDSAIRARQRILTTIGDGILLAGGVGGTVFCLMLLGAAGRLRQDRRGLLARTVEPRPLAYPYSHPAARGATGAIAGWLRQGGGRVRIGLLVVSAEAVQDLPQMDGVIELADPSPATGTDMAAERSIPGSDAPAGRVPAPSRAADLPVLAYKQRSDTVPAPVKTETTSNPKQPVSQTSAPAQPAADGGGGRRPAPPHTNSKTNRAGKGKTHGRKAGRGQNFY